jgi:IclR family acetate operon transcriptional repressor
MTPTGPAGSPSRAGEGVQSLHRALDLVEIVAAHGGQLAIGEIAAASDIPLPTIHRLLRTLVTRGYMRQLPNRRYALGFRLVPLGATAGTMLGADTDRVLARLVDALGETANLAILVGEHAEYVAQAPSRHSMRMFTEVGRRVELHCTGVGKALLAQLDDDRVRGVVHRVGLPRHTARTHVSEAALLEDLDAIRSRGYAVDEQEQEDGVRCVAVPVGPAELSAMAVSVSGPVTRITDDVVARAVPLLVEAGARLAADLLSRP